MAASAAFSAWAANSSNLVVWFSWAGVEDSHRVVEGRRMRVGRVALGARPSRRAARQTVRAPPDAISVQAECFLMDGFAD